MTEAADLARHLDAEGTVTEIQENLLAVWLRLPAPASVLPVERWVRLWQKAGRVGEIPREPFLIWRAATPSGARGMSWARRPGITERYLGVSPQARLYRTKVHPSAVLAVIHFSSEIVVDPARLGWVEEVERPARQGRQQQARRREQARRQEEARREARLRETRRREDARRRYKEARRREEARQKEADRERERRKTDPDWLARMASHERRLLREPDLRAEVPTVEPFVPRSREEILADLMAQVKRS